MMISILIKIIQVLKNNLSIVFLCTTLLFGGITLYQKSKIGKMDSTITNLNNNVKELQHDKYSIDNDNRVLTLKLNDLDDYNDRLIHTADSLRSSLKKAKNHIKQITAISTSMTDTLAIQISKENINNTAILDSVITTNCDFCITIEPNPLTSINVCKEGDSLKVIPNIRDELFVYIAEKRVWRNKRKNCFDRLFHWDWKKDKVLDYEIIHSNPLIHTDNARIINIDE